MSRLGYKKIKIWYQLKFHVIILYMVIYSVEFIKSAANVKDFPKLPYPEIAFAGRSNVGKSSLINALIHHKKVARVSSTPGMTQLINFFTINKKLTFVDLPGYGYAKVPKKVKAKWGNMVEGYIKNRPQLKAVIAILDIRHVPTDMDINLFKWLEDLNIQIIPVATKADKINRSQLNKQVKIINEKLLLSEKVLIPFSAKTRLGVKELWQRILLSAGISQKDIKKGRRF